MFEPNLRFLPTLQHGLAKLQAVTLQRKGLYIIDLQYGDSGSYHRLGDVHGSAPAQVRAVRVMRALEKTVVIAFEKVEEQQAIAMVPGVAGIGGTAAAAVLGSLSSIGVVTQSIGGPNGVATELLPFSQQAATAGNSGNPRKKESLIAAHLLQRMTASAAPIAGAR